MQRLLQIITAAILLSSFVLAADGFPPTKFPDSSGWGKNIQRTMRLLATSTAERRNTVRILFYGQSITEQKWAKRVEEDLRRRFPHAKLANETNDWNVDCGLRSFSHFPLGTSAARR